MKFDVVVVGAGLAGLSCAKFLEDSTDTELSTVLLEMNPSVGGKAVTHQRDGFKWDIGGHWLHIGDPTLKDFVNRIVGSENFVSISRKCRIFSQGVYTQYPYQSNLFGLPRQFVAQCLSDAVDAHLTRSLNPDAKEPYNFDEWVRFYFGDSITDAFFVPYNCKQLGVSVKDLTSDWCQRFVPKPDIHSIIRGSVGHSDTQFGPLRQFMYPKCGGIEILPQSIAKSLAVTEIRSSCRVCNINLDAKYIEYLDHESVKHRIYYEKLVSTIPLNKFIGIQEVIPQAIKESASKLKYTSTRYVNIGVRGATQVPDHWIYVPEDKYPFFRVNIFSNALDAMAPSGHSSVSVEFSDRHSDIDALTQSAIHGLYEMGILTAKNEVLFTEDFEVPLSYVIYDEFYRNSRDVIFDWLSNYQNVFSIGRYGSWNYSAMEDAMRMGRETALKLV